MAAVPAPSEGRSNGPSPTDLRGLGREQFLAQRAEPAATVAAGAALVAIHRLLSIATIRWPRLEDLVSGHEILIIRNGKLDARAMRQALLTERNLREAVRQKLGEADFSRVTLAILERDGKITVVGSKAAQEGAR